MAIGIFFGGMGLPGLCGFVGEVMVTLSAWNFSAALAVISASVVVITASYILWTLQRVLLGGEYKGPHPEALTPMTWRESWIAAPLFAFCIFFGVYPQSVFNFVTPSVNRTVEELASWAEDNRPAELTTSEQTAELPH
jgi:NADH-quinone oxidoreductase subunit M